MNSALSTLNRIQFAPWCEPHFRPINKFYKSQKHKGKANGHDRVFYAYRVQDEEHQVVAAVRLVPYAEGSEVEYFWLRSMYVADELRGSGIGLKLLQCVAQHIDTQPIYCFPYEHLEHFYGQAAYEGLSATQLPDPLQDLYNRYIQRGEKIIVMAKSPLPPP